MGVLDKQLEGKQYVIGDELTIADFAIYPWVSFFIERYNNIDEIKKETFNNVVDWVNRLKDRPSIVKGFEVGKI